MPKLHVRFTGLCLFVADYPKGEKAYTVLLPDARPQRFPRKPGDKASAPKPEGSDPAKWNRHVSVLAFHPRHVGLTDAAESARVVIPLRRQGIELTGKTEHEPKLPAQIPLVTKLGGKPIDPDNLPSPDGAELGPEVGGCLVLRRGELIVERNIDEWEVKTEDGSYAAGPLLCWRARWSAEVDGGPVTVRLSAFDKTQPSLSLRLQPDDKGDVAIEIRNVLPQHLLTDPADDHAGHAGDDVDHDFKWFYRLLDGQPDTAKLPVPRKKSEGPRTSGSQTCVLGGGG